MNARPRLHLAFPVRDLVETRTFYKNVPGCREWQVLAGKPNRAHLDFVIASNVLFKGQAGEQATFFIRDPCGNALEFKAFHDETRIFAQ